MTFASLLIEQKDAPQPEQREAAPLPSGLIELELAGARARIPVTAGREVILAVIDGLSMRRRLFSGRFHHGSILRPSLSISAKAWMGSRRL
jgi:hypothetical protein